MTITKYSFPSLLINNGEIERQPFVSLAFGNLSRLKQAEASLFPLC